MYRWQITMLIVCSVIQVVLGCAATSPGTTPTTISPMRTTTTTTRTPSVTATIRVTTTTTTRTTTTTTAATALACQSCTVSQVSFDTANGDPGRIDADFRVEPNDPQTDCLRLTAICSAQAGFAAFMEFNVNQGGPEENQNFVQVLEVPLECVDGAWYYRTSTIQQVNSVQCTEFNAAG